MKPVLICTILLLQPVLILSYSEDDIEDASDDTSQYRARRGWSMMRLGRGLQMLRLGKRASPASLNENGSPSTPDQMRAMLSALVDGARHEFRRQPPLPRYGRELDLALTPEELYALTGPSGRVKRAADNAPGASSPDGYGDAAAAAYSDNYGYLYPVDALSSSQARAVALPRIGRFLGRQPHKHRPAKAVPIPRIGRQDDVTAPQNDAVKNR